MNEQLLIPVQTTLKKHMQHSIRTEMIEIRQEIK